MAGYLNVFNNRMLKMNNRKD